MTTLKCEIKDKVLEEEIHLDIKFTYKDVEYSINSHFVGGMSNQIIINLACACAYEINMELLKK